MDAVAHRFDMGYNYSGIPIHAARGVHEYADRLARKHILAPGRPRILDVGSGSGALAARLSFWADIIATDINLDGIWDGCKSVVWDAGNESAPLPAEEGFFDGVVAVEILEHVENPRAALRNLRRLLHLEGTLIISTPHIGNVKSRLKHLFTGEPCYFGHKEYTASGHQTLLPDWLLANHLRAEGFDIIETRYAGTMDMSPAQRLVFPLISFVGRTFLRTPRVDDGDGACVFFVCRPKH